MKDNHHSVMRAEDKGWLTKSYKQQQLAIFRRGMHHYKREIIQIEKKEQFVNSLGNVTDDQKSLGEVS